MGRRPTPAAAGSSCRCSLTAQSMSDLVSVLIRSLGAIITIGTLCLAAWALWSTGAASSSSRIVGVLPAAPALVDVPLGAAGRRLPVLIMQVDDRPVNASYIARTAVINYLYARRHGYDYRYARIESDEAHLAEAVNPPKNPSSNTKACFHPILGVQRASPWCKILPSWLAAHETAYDYVLFMDSDVCVGTAVDFRGEGWCRSRVPESAPKPQVHSRTSRRPVVLRTARQQLMGSHRP